MNDHIHPVMQAALAPFSPPPAVESLNDDDTYIVDLLENRVVRRCSDYLLRAGGSIPVGLGQAVLTGMQARNRIASEAKRRARIGKPQIPDELLQVLTKASAALHMARRWSTNDRDEIVFARAVSDLDSAIDKLKGGATPAKAGGVA